MTDRLPKRSAVTELAERIADRQRQPVKMTGSTTDTGATDSETVVRGLPYPLGTEDQVLTVVDVGGDLVPAWADPATGSTYTDEQARDAIGAVLVPGNNVDITVDDALNTITIDVEALTESDIASLVSDLATLSAASHAAATVLDSANIDFSISGQQITANLTTAAKTSTINFVIDGGGAAITTGVKGDLIVDFACTISANTLVADQNGSIVIDIWKDTYANFPPTVADTITASAKPTLSAANKSQDTTLTGWTTSVAAGDILRFNVDSAATVQRVTLSLKIVRS